MKGKQAETEERENTPPVPTAREYQQWEDWAMWDEMHRQPTRKRRLQMEVRCGGASSSSRVAASCPLGDWNGTRELEICLRMTPGEVDREAAREGVEPGTAADSEASTVMVGAACEACRATCFGTG